MLREEFELLDADSPEPTWDRSCCAGVGALMEELGEPEAAERNAALLAVPLGIEPPEDVASPDADDPQRSARRSSRPPAP